MKKLLYTLGAIFFILIITNPKLSDFKEYKNSKYLGETSEKEFNFFVCSLYKKKYVYLNDNGLDKHITKTYLGILGNFFLCKEIKSR